MSDLKALFRAKQSERPTVAKPSLQQLKALKAKRPAEQPAQEPAAKRVSSLLATASKPPPTAGSSQTLPSDFFDNKGEASAASGKPTGAKQTATAQAADAAKAALPTGFFDDKAADAKARGVKLPDKEDKEAEFKQFQAMIEEEIKDSATREAEEAAEEAAEKEEREAYEQELRLQRVEELRQRKALNAGEVGEEMPKLEVARKRQRVLDSLLLGGAGDEEEDDVSEDDLLDWRAKGV